VLVAADSQGGGSSLFPFLMLLLLFGAMYFLFFRPNSRRRRQVAQMQSTLGVGDEVLTIGGLYGVVESIDDDRIELEVSPGVTNVYSRGAISQIVKPADSLDEPSDDERSDDEPRSADEPTSLKKIVDTD
jgi:preprotein translocase subunit YajC